MQVCVQLEIALVGTGLDPVHFERENVVRIMEHACMTRNSLYLVAEVHNTLLLVQYSRY